MRNKIRHPQWQILLPTLIVLIWFVGPIQALEVVVSGQITYEVRDGLYVDKGADEGLRQSMFGSMRLNDGRIFEFEVLHVTRKSALLRLAGRSIKQEKLVGQAVELIFEQSLRDQEDKDKSRQSPIASPGNANDDKFVPLLAPPEWTVGLPKSSNIFHGQMRIRQMLQLDNEDLLDYSMTRLGSSGSLDRIEGSQWSFEWSGDLAYRDGDAFIYHSDYQDPRFDLYMASFQHPLADDGFFRFGRFLPRELPGIGYVDGIHRQISRADDLRFGTVIGFKPDLNNLDPSVDNPFLAAYATFETGNQNGQRYLGTVGLLGSLYKGEADRMALLFDQRAGLGTSFTLYSTAEVDFDVGGAESRTGTRLTRLDVFAVSKLSSFLTLRAGLDHWERPDNRAERDLLIIEDDRLFDRGYWRYWIGSDLDLPWKLRLSDEVAFIDSPEFDYGPRWRVGLTRTGLFSWQDATATAVLYNLEAQGMDGYGGRFSAYLPLLKHKLFIQPVAGFRMLDAKPQSKDFTLSYLSLRINGRLSSNWNLFGGFTHSYGDNVDTNLLDIGLRYRW